MGPDRRTTRGCLPSRHRAGLLSASEPRLGLVVALDLLAAYLAPGGPTRVITSDPALPTAIHSRLPTTVDEPGSLLALHPFDPRVLAAAIDRLEPGKRIGIVRPGPLAPLFATLRDRRPVSMGVCDGRDKRIAIDFRCGVGDLSTAILAIAARAADRADRPDLADRLEIAYRRSLRPRPAAWLVEVLITVGRRCL